MSVPHAVGPVLLRQYGGLVAVRAPRDRAILAALRRARAELGPRHRPMVGGLARVERLVAELQVVVDPLFHSIRLKNWVQQLESGEERFSAQAAARIDTRLLPH